MKRCPTCSRVYDDVTLRFCLDDGTELVAKPAPAPPTLVLPANERPQSTIEVSQPPLLYDREANTPGKRGPRRVAVWILAIGLLVAIVTGGIFAMAMLREDRLAWYLVLEVDPTVADRPAITSRVQQIIERRLDAVGIRSFRVEPQGDLSQGRLIVRLPAINDPNRIKQLITTQGKLELVHVFSPPSPAPVKTYDSKEAALASLKSISQQPDPSGPIPHVLPYANREAGAQTKWVVVEAPAIVDGASIRNATAFPYLVTDNYQISFTLNKDGADKFGKWTGANINEYMGVVLNDEVKSIAFIKSQIFDQAEISGRFTKEVAEDLALVLRSGALGAPVKLVEEGVVK